MSKSLRAQDFWIKYMYGKSPQFTTKQNKKKIISWDSVSGSKKKLMISEILLGHMTFCFCGIWTKV
jgi:hypothetical protein